MYHLDDDEYLSEPYYRKTQSVCPECLERVDAEIYEENDQIWMQKTCPEHGYFKDKPALVITTLFNLIKLCISPDVENVPTKRYFVR